jgi:hypothetical protein
MTLNYELAGLLDRNGNMGRQVPAGQIVVPEKIWLKDDCIRWRMGRRPRMREVSRSMLNQFIRLSDAHSVLRFAHEWGVLALSENMYSGSEPGGRYYLPGREPMKTGVEPVDAWRYYSKRAQALLNLAAALKLGKLGDRSDWGEFAVWVSDLSGPDRYGQLKRRLEASAKRHTFGLGFSVYSGDSGTPEQKLRSARWGLAGEACYWFECWKAKKTGAVSDFALRWVDDQQRWDLQIDYHGLLFPAIALQLALVIADADSLYSCSGCGVPYIRARERKRPKTGWANYCDQCSNDGVAQRRAAETYREKKAEAVRLHSGGASFSKIAELLHTTVTRAREWTNKRAMAAKSKSGS